MLVALGSRFSPPCEYSGPGAQASGTLRGAWLERRRIEKVDERYHTGIRRRPNLT